MSKPSDVSWIQRLTGRRQVVRRAPEPADLGTAFGMEEWLSNPASPAPATQPATPRPAARSGWRARWLPGTPTR